MSNLLQTYQMSTNPVTPVDWEMYEKNSLTIFKDLLDKCSPEIELQKYFEQNPCYVPGAYGLQTKSGHAPMHSCLFTQPRLPGLAAKIPDFMWIAKNSDYIHPILIEIEAPEKNFFNQDHSISAIFTQAKTQIMDWKSWFEDPVNIQVFQREYRINDRFQFNQRKIKPYFVLIYGRSTEMESVQIRADRKAQFSDDTTTVMSYDRLCPSYDQKHYFTGQAKADGFYVKQFPEYLKLSPELASDIHIFKEKRESVLSNQHIPIARKTFLLERLEYWETWVVQGPSGVMSTGDSE